MLKLLIYCVLVYGFTNIMVFGSIFDGFRNFWVKNSPKFFGKLFTCPLCLSTWIGFGMSFMMLNMGVVTPMIALGFIEPIVIIFFDGIFASGAVWLIHTLQEKLEK